jgi:hypothetical protein
LGSVPVWRSYLSEHHAGVGVLDGRHSPIRIDVRIGLLLHAGKVQELDLIRQTEFLKHDGNFPGVGALDRSHFSIGESLPIIIRT